MRIVVLVFSLIIISLQLNAQNNSEESIKWLDINQAIELQKTQPKLILIDMYTDWCGWCKKMDATSFNHPGIAMFINTNFYPVKFDCESRDTVFYKDSTFINNGPVTNDRRKPAHDLAKYLLNGRLSYPSLVFIDEDFNHYPVAGYRDVPQIEPLLIYFSERIYKTASYQEFEENFNKTYRPVRDSVYPELQGRVEWINFDELPTVFEKEPRKIILQIYHEQTRGSQVMTATTFTHPIIADIINENYYAIRLNVLSQDSISFLGRDFGNQNQSSGYPHDLVIALLQPTITVPATIFLDESFGLIYALRGYASAPLFELYLEFINKNLYRNGDNAWVEFVNSYESKIE
jgi:thioredoxin-related protein